MKARTYLLFALGAWAILLVHFLGRDQDAFVLSLVLTPPLAVLLLAAIQSGHLVLSIFMGFALISHAIAPPFFFMGRRFYSYGGDFGAVKDFRFGVQEFLGIYAYVFLFLAATVAFGLWLSSWRRRAVTAKDRPNRPGREVEPDIRGKLSPRMRSRCTWLLALFIVFVGVPLSLFMYSMRVGLTGLEAPVLPYRLTGITTYFRMFVIPILLFGLYSASNRSWFLTVLVVFYAALGGFASVSRYFVFATVAPVALFPLVDRKMVRFVTVAAATAAIFMLVTESRNYVYGRAQMPLLELVQTTIAGYDPAEFSGFDVVGGIANRLWGPQDVVLAYQYQVPDRLAAIANYFALRPVVPDLTYEFYGMIFSGDSAAFGVGIGYIPWMIVLANRSIPALLGLALITACLLTVSERLANVFRWHRGRLWNAGGQAAAFLFVYLIYTSNMNWWYEAVLLACLPALFLRLRDQMATPRKAPRRRSALPGAHDPVSTPLPIAE